MFPDHATDPDRSLERAFQVPVIVTSFRDFELEERAVRLLAQMGFAIGDRKIVGAREVGESEILVTDTRALVRGAPSIIVDPQMHHWSDATLHRHLYRQFIPVGDRGAEVVITSSVAQQQLRGDLIAALTRAQIKAIQATFDERDIRLALIPTRRREEIDRLDRFAKASLALHVLDADLRELALAQSLIEYRRRIHTHLELCFLVVGGRKRIRSQIAISLEPFPIFWIEDEREDLVRLVWSARRQGSDRFEQIVKWIGSRHGDSRQSRSDLDTTRRSRDCAPFRVGSPVATPR